MVLEYPNKVFNIQHNLEKSNDENFIYKYNGKTIKFNDDGIYLLNVIVNKSSIKSKCKMNAYIKSDKNTIITSKTNDNLLIIHEIIKVKKNDKLKIKNDSNQKLKILNMNIDRISEN